MTTGPYSSIGPFPIPNGAGGTSTTYFNPKNSTRVATTAALTATYANGTAGVGATLTNSTTQAAISIDSVSLSANDRVLVKNQSSGFQNGIYYVSTVGSGATNWVLTRVTDYDQISQIKYGDTIAVVEGTTNALSGWLQTAASPATIGTDSLTFSKDTSTGVSSVSGTSNRITSSGGATPVIDIDAAYVGQTSLTTLGTVSTGVWQGTRIATAYGGSLPVNVISGTSGTLAVNSINVLTNAAQVALAMPANGSFSANDVVYVEGEGAGGYVITLNGSQQSFGFSGGATARNTTAGGTISTQTSDGTASIATPGCNIGFRFKANDVFWITNSEGNFIFA